MPNDPYQVVGSPSSYNAPVLNWSQILNPSQPNRPPAGQAPTQQNDDRRNPSAGQGQVQHLNEPDHRQPQGLLGTMGLNGGQSPGTGPFGLPQSGPLAQLNNPNSGFMSMLQKFLQSPQGGAGFQDAGGGPQVPNVGAPGNYFIQPNGMGYF